MVKAIDIIEMLDQLPDERVNPVINDINCAYTDSQGNHCIAGEILVRLGFDVPAYGSNDNTETIANIIYDYELDFDEAAANILAIGQSVADTETHNGLDNAWELAKKAMLQEYDDFYKEIYA